MQIGSARQRIRFLCLVALVAHVVGCSELPDDFQSLPLEEKVAAYEKYCGGGAGRHLVAQMQIAWHGWEAADLMAEYLNGTRRGIPKTEAITIIDMVQARGCSLRGTPAERALEEFLAIAPADSSDASAAKSALSAIREDRYFPKQAHMYPGGPCQQGSETIEQD